MRPPNPPADPTPLVDIHCHLNDRAFDSDRDQVVERALSCDVKTLIVPAVTAADWVSIQQLGESYQQILVNYGLHPLFLTHHKPEHLAQLVTCLGSDSNVVAVGECGLDYMDKNADKTAQKDYFTAQLAIAKQHGLPVVVHARRAVEDVILEIKASGHFNGVLHSYSGSFEQAKRLLDLGYIFSFGGAITYNRATKLRRLISQLPLDSLLLESDAPFQPDTDILPGGRSSPDRITRVLDTLCSLRNEPRDQIAQQTTDNADRVFRIERSSG